MVTLNRFEELRYLYTRIIWEPNCVKRRTHQKTVRNIVMGDPYPTSGLRPACLSKLSNQKLLSPSKKKLKHTSPFTSHQVALAPNWMISIIFTAAK